MLIKQFTMCSAASIQNAETKHIQTKAILPAQDRTGRGSGPVQLEGGRCVLHRSIVSVPSQVLQSGNIKEKE